MNQRLHQAVEKYRKAKNDYNNAHDLHKSNPSKDRKAWTDLEVRLRTHLGAAEKEIIDAAEEQAAIPNLDEKNAHIKHKQNEDTNALLGRALSNYNYMITRPIIERDLRFKIWLERHPDAHECPKEMVDTENAAILGINKVANELLKGWLKEIIDRL